MRGRHKRISAGTIVMTIAAAIVLFCAIWMILAIRNPNADLSMDAERLVSSIGELAAGVASAGYRADNARPARARRLLRKCTRLRQRWQHSLPPCRSSLPQRSRPNRPVISVR